MSGSFAGVSDLPLAAILRAARIRQSLSLQAVATRVNSAAQADGERGVMTNRKRVSSWEGGEIPRPATLRWLAKALNLNLETVVRAAQEQVTRRQALRGAAVIGGTLITHDPEHLLALLSAVSTLGTDPMAGAPPISRRILEDLHGFSRHHGQQWGRVAPRSLMPSVTTNLALLRGWLPSAMTADLRRNLHVVTAETAWLAGWLSSQLDNRGDAAGYWAFARSLAMETLEKPLLAHVLIATSSLSSSVAGSPYADPPRANGLLHAARAAAGPGSSKALLSWIHARLAEEAALAGDSRSAARDFHEADRLLEATSSPGNGLLADWDQRRLAVWRAHCTIRSADDLPVPILTEAVGALEETLAQLEPSRLYDRSRALIELAEGYVRQREIDHSCVTLMESLALTVDGGLLGHIHRIRRARSLLTPWQHTAKVRELDERLQAAP